MSSFVRRGKCERLYFPDNLIADNFSRYRKNREISTTLVKFHKYVSHREKTKKYTRIFYAIRKLQKIPIQRSKKMFGKSRSKFESRLTIASKSYTFERLDDSKKE